MYDKKSLYALNKRDPEHITYTDAVSGKVTLSREAFSSNQEFMKWKSWSDSEYHREEQEDNRYSRHNYPMVFAADFVEPDTAETVLIARVARKEQIADSIRAVAVIHSIVTETQFRRMWLYYVLGKTEVQIAVLEGCSHQMISKSLTAARRRIFKRLSGSILHSDADITIIKSMRKDG